MARFALITALALAACTGYPDLGAAPGGNGAAGRAEYPRLVPLVPLLGQATTGQLTDPTMARDLTARAERLRARARTLRTSAVSDAEVQALRAALARNAARTPR